MITKTKSSKTNPENPFFHTETTWRIVLDDQGDATHSLVIKVLNPEFVQPATNLSFELPASGFYTDFLTEVNGQAFSPGKGYIERNKRYSLSLGEVLGNNSETIITVSFKHRGASVQLGDASLVFWPFILRMRGSVDLEVILPPLRGYKRIITWIIRMLERKDHYFIIHQIDLPPLAISARHVDPRKGILKYLLQDSTVIPGFAFESYSSISLYTALVGIAALIYAIIMIIAAIV